MLVAFPTKRLGHKYIKAVTDIRHYKRHSNPSPKYAVFSRSSLWSELRVSAKRTLRCISRPDAAIRLVLLGQLYMVIIDHIYKNQLHASTCRLEKFYMVEYWKICFYFPFLSFPILYHVKFGICFPRLLPF